MTLFDAFLLVCVFLLAATCGVLNLKIEELHDALIAHATTHATINKALDELAKGNQ